MQPDTTTQLFETAVCRNPECLRTFERLVSQHDTRTFCTIHCAARYFNEKHRDYFDSRPLFAPTAMTYSLAPGVNLIKEFLRLYGAREAKRHHRGLEQMITEAT